MSYLIKVYHSSEQGKSAFQSFIQDLYKMLKCPFTLGLHYSKGEIFYSLNIEKKNYSIFEAQFYSNFNDFQITTTTKPFEKFDKKTTILGEVTLDNKGVFPFKMDGEGDVISSLFRSFENLNVIKDTIALYFEFTATKTDGIDFWIASRWASWTLKRKLFFQFYKYLFSPKVQPGWKSIGEKYFYEKIKKNLFATKIYFVVSSDDKEQAEGKMKAIFNNYKVFSKFPFNKFLLKIRKNVPTIGKTDKIDTSSLSKMQLTMEEIALLFHFPKNPKAETSLLTVKAKKLALPVMIPSFGYEVQSNGEVRPKEYPDDINIVGISDYRSITVPIGIYDEDRLRHLYVVGKTGTGKSKFLLSLMVNDVKQGKGIWIIDPHGDAIDELMMHIPERRKEDVVIFDPTDEKFPFCMNPLDVQENESKQILAKGFIDIFEKFFGANWNPKLEHVLRMLFLALLDKPNATLYDMIRALTDKDFRYEMINYVGDDVVRNFRTNEFAGWSQQFNTEAIMPILNKVGQLLSIDIIKNIFASPESKLDLRSIMDTKKILLIKLPKGKLQSEVMGFLGAMFVTKIFQTAMGRANLEKKDRIPFFLYIDEFQNFATKTFNEILSEARKYWLSLAVAHQFISQIPKDISESLFGNVGTLVSFRISSEDAEYMKQHFSPFLTAYDLANLNMREFYCKLLVKGQVTDPFSLKSCWIPDADIKRGYVDELYAVSRAKYARTLQKAKEVVAEQADVIKMIDDFAGPIV